ncbi:hypothetical protein [Fodinicola feengrottensis]|uniref:YtxH domain-containing protein n=1 Tax=Fodinicola feengrottensis TaxID=435914 RepID=A0ABP4VD70_9ACTN|nr:hypothetical protein [Fodinicola feengrottensis]
MSTMTKVAFVAGLAVGYVLGTRAGRERYDQIRRLARAVRENPTVQETAGIVQAQATNAVVGARDIVADRLAQTPVGERFAAVFSNAPSGHVNGAGPA